MRARALNNLLAVTLIALLLHGCAGLGDGITDLSLVISSSDGVNPDQNGRPSPIFLQVFELRDGAAFRNSSYLDIYRDPEGALGGAYIAKSEVGPVYPGANITEELRLSPSAVAVGIIGEFNRYQSMNSTMLLVELEPGQDKKVKLLIDAKGIWIR